MPSSALSLKRVKQLGSELLSSKTHINHAPVLLSILSAHGSSSNSSLPPDAEDCLLEALSSLQAFFVALFGRGELSPKALEGLQARINAGDQAKEERAEAIYKSWLWDKYNEFLEVLLRLISNAKTVPSLQATGLDALMEFVRHEKQGEFRNRIFSKICSHLVLQESKSNIIEHFVAHYLKYFDVCCYTCANLEKVAVEGCGLQDKDGGTILNDSGTVDKSSLELILCNVYDILACLSIPKKSGKNENAELESWSKGTLSGDERPSAAAEVGKPKSVDTTRKKDLRKLKSKVTKAWLTLLRLPLPGRIYEKVLGHMHNKIIPNISNPILLSDFLTKSYDKGGVISVMALSGLFLLITEYGLEYPEFYSKLYVLLEPSIFLAKYRARFFELLDTCLKSPLLPAYLAAAFAKKLGRMALTSPPSGALIVIAIVHNLLRRHPSINCLVHGDSEVAEAECKPDYNADVLKKKLREPNADGSSGMLETAGRIGLDPYDFSEPDPAKCNALKSSLWEMDTLRHHYCPAVSRFVLSLEADLTVRAKTTELAIKDFSSGSYASIFAEEVGRRMKQVPLAFYKSIPTTLFPSVSKMEAQELMDFPGWTFRWEENVPNTEGNSAGDLLQEHSSTKPDLVEIETYKGHKKEQTVHPRKKKKIR